MAKTTDAHTGHVRESSGRVTTDAGREGALSSVNGGQWTGIRIPFRAISGLCVSHCGDVVYDQQPKAAARWHAIMPCWPDRGEGHVADSGRIIGRHQKGRCVSGEGARLAFNSDPLEKEGKMLM